jgi:hypothetical protein
MTIRPDPIIAMPSHKQSFSKRPEPKPPGLGLADAKHRGDLSHRKSILEKRRRSLKNGRTQIASGPTDALIKCIWL